MFRVSLFTWDGSKTNNGSSRDIEVREEGERGTESGRFWPPIAFSPPPPLPPLQSHNKQWRQEKRSWMIQLLFTLLLHFWRSLITHIYQNPNTAFLIHYWIPTFTKLSGSPAKSGPLDFGTKNNFPSFFVSEKGLVHIYKNETYYFPVVYFCFATSQNWILAEPRLPTVIRKVKFTDFVKRATSPKMQLTEFRFHTNSKVHSILWLWKYGNFSENSK